MVSAEILNLRKYFLIFKEISFCLQAKGWRKKTYFVNSKKFDNFLKKYDKENFVKKNNKKFSDETNLFIHNLEDIVYTLEIIFDSLGEDDMLSKKSYDNYQEKLVILRRQVSQFKILLKENKYSSNKGLSYEFGQFVKATLLITMSVSQLTACNLDLGISSNISNVDDSTEVQDELTDVELYFKNLADPNLNLIISEVELKYPDDKDFKIKFLKLLKEIYDGNKNKTFELYENLNQILNFNPPKEIFLSYLSKKNQGDEKYLNYLKIILENPNQEYKNVMFELILEEKKITDSFSKEIFYSSFEILTNISYNVSFSYEEIKDMYEIFTNHRYGQDLVKEIYSHKYRFDLVKNLFINKGDIDYSNYSHEDIVLALKYSFSHIRSISEMFYGKENLTSTDLVKYFENPRFLGFEILDEVDFLPLKDLEKTRRYEIILLISEYLYENNLIYSVENISLAYEKVKDSKFNLK